MDRKEGTTKFAKDAKRNAKILCKEESYENIGAWFNVFELNMTLDSRKKPDENL